MLAVLLQQLAHIHNKTVFSCPSSSREWSCSINNRRFKEYPPPHLWQHSNIHLQLSVLPLRFATSGLRLGNRDRLELFIGHVSAGFIPRRSQQQEWQGKRYREHPGPPAKHHSGLRLWPRILICAWVILECSSAMIYDHPTHLIFSVFVDLEDLVRQLVGLEAFAVKDKQTEVT